MVGIYAFIYDDKYAYVGQSIDVEKRLNEHQRDIHLHRHPNMELIGEYDESKVKYELLKECEIGELNYYEKYFFLLKSFSYIMLNKRDCGIQGIAGTNIVFRDCEIPILSFRNDNFYINNIPLSKYENLHCISELINYVINNSNSTRKLNAIINSDFTISRIEALYKISIDEKRRAIKPLKKLGVYKTIGARDKRKVYVDKYLFLTIAYNSCPQFMPSIAKIILDNRNA